MVYRTFGFLAVVCIWWTVSVFYGNRIIAPSPADVAKSIFDISSNYQLFREAGITTFRCFVGLIISGMAGLFLGIVIGLSKKVYDALSPVVVFLQSSPAISWLLLALIWFGSGTVPVFLIIVSTMPIIIINTAEGIVQTDKKILEMAHLFKVKKKDIVKGIYIPEITGYLISSAKIVLSNAFKVGVMAEVLSHPGNGIGDRMAWARINIDTAELIAWTVIIVSIAFFLKLLLEILIEKYLKPLV